MARLIWAEPALSDLEEIAEYIALDNRPAATRYVRRVFTAVIPFYIGQFNSRLFSNCLKNCEKLSRNSDRPNVRRDNRYVSTPGREKRMMM